mmetsp:Transcript_1643/g.3575  ORF Transcript_1643/g.3575 Transcript_1643/m.3575 type:complete len:182 (+) Transcript_1643:298-843(+)
MLTFSRALSRTCFAPVLRPSHARPQSSPPLRGKTSSDDSLLSPSTALSPGSVVPAFGVSSSVSLRTPAPAGEWISALLCDALLWDDAGEEEDDEEEPECFANPTSDSASESFHVFRDALWFWLRGLEQEEDIDSASRGVEAPSKGASAAALPSPFSIVARSALAGFSFLPRNVLMAGFDEK